RRRELQRLEAHHRRLVIQRRLQQVHLCLEQIALRLRHEKARREPHLVSTLFRLEPLQGERRSRARGILALRRAADLPRRLPNGLRNIELQARDAGGSLPALYLRPDGSDLLEAAAKRVADGDAEAPRGIVAAEHLAEHIAKARVDAAADDSRK